MRNFQRLTFSLMMTFAIFATATVEGALTNKKDDVSTIIVTGYSIHSRLLADLLQFYTKQPVIFITQPDAKEVLFVPAQKKNLEAKPFKISASEFHNFVNFAHPNQVVLLGEDKFIPKFYKDVINPNIKTYSLQDKDWLIIATQCEELFGTSGLADKFRSELKRLARGGAKLDSNSVNEPQIVLP